MEDFLKELGIKNDTIETDDGCLKIDIPNSNEYGKIYSRLDKSDLVEEDEDSSQITIDTASIQYENDDYLITLLADFEEDIYSLTIKER